MIRRENKWSNMILSLNCELFFNFYYGHWKLFLVIVIRGRYLRIIQASLFLVDRLHFMKWIFIIWLSYIYDALSNRCFSHSLSIFNGRLSTIVHLPFHPSAHGISNVVERIIFYLSWAEWIMGGSPWGIQGLSNLCFSLLRLPNSETCQSRRILFGYKFLVEGNVDIWIKVGKVMLLLIRTTILLLGRLERVLAIVLIISVFISFWLLIYSLNIWLKLQILRFSNCHFVELWWR